MITQACGSLILMLVDHRVLWKFKALWPFLLDDLYIIGYPNVKPKTLHRAKTCLTPLF